jgi:predicted transcriptional regulator
MDRMVHKGLLKTERLCNLMLYRAVITRKKAQQGEVMRTVKRAFNGTLTPIMQCLLDSDNMTLDDLDEMEEMIRRKKAGSKA